MEPAESIQKSSTKRKFPKRSKRYQDDFKLQIVKKHLEESIPVSVIHQECGSSSGTVGRWVRAYRREGEAGLSKSYNGKGRSLPAPVRQKIVEIKEANPRLPFYMVGRMEGQSVVLRAEKGRLEKTLSKAQGARKAETPPSKDQKPSGEALRKAEKP